MVSVDGAHTADVNVISWNHKVPFLLASGSDDGAIKVWDLRMLKPQQGKGGPKVEPVGFFQWHKEPITSIEWHPQDDTVLAAAGADNMVSVWDFGLEEDAEQAQALPQLQSEVIGAAGTKVDIPPQLLFLHEGQEDIKEIHFHSQIPGMIGSTAADGFHAFIPEPLDIDLIV
jgi:ribosome assembly protein RRB1